MEKILRFIVGLAAFATIGGAGYFGVMTAGAQTGGGFPSQPKFQTVTAQAANAGTAKNIVDFNPTSGAAAASALDIRNNLNAVNHELELVYTSSTFSGAFLTSGPTGEAAAIYTTANQSMCIGTNGICVMNMDGPTQTVNFPSTTIPLELGAHRFLLSYNINFNGVGVPVLQTCVQCGASPTAARTGVGTYTVTHNGGFGGNQLTICSPNNSAGLPNYAYAVRGGGANVDNITLATFAGAAVDGTASQSLNCYITPG
jgi:hypothetical protein